MGGLTPKQQAFVREYLLDGNATRAAAKAGYSARTAGQIGFNLLKKVEIQEALAEARKALEAKAEVEAVRVIREQAAIAFSNIAELFDFDGDTLRLKSLSEIPEAARRAVASFKVRRHVEGQGENARVVEVTEIHLWSKSDALDKLARILGLYDPEKAAPSGVDGTQPSETLEECLDRLAGIRRQQRASASTAEQ